jgi:hypothetical protein
VAVRRLETVHVECNFAAVARTRIVIGSSSAAGSQKTARIEDPPNAKAVESARVMSEEQADCFPNCRIRFEIVSAKFKFGGVAMIASCPNCAVVAEWPTAKSEILDELKKFGARLERCCRRRVVPARPATGPSTGGSSMGLLTRREILILAVGTAILEAPSSRLLCL